jgi:hypothetical protein
MRLGLRLIGLACVLALLCLDGARSAPAPTRLFVTPDTGIDATQTAGQAKSFVYKLTTNRGSINWACAAPVWLKCSAASGKTAATVTLTTAVGLAAGTYTGSVTFKASTNVITLPARLVVTAVVTPPPPPPPSTGCPGALLDSSGGRLTYAGGILTCP